MIDELSFTALSHKAVVRHVTASRAKVGVDSVVAVGPIGVLRDHSTHRRSSPGPRCTRSLRSGVL